MQIKSIKISGQPPIKRFEVDELKSVVFIAGPNGIGKTRLMNSILNSFRQLNVNTQVSCVVSATSAAEREAWGNKSELDLSNSADIATLKPTLHKNRKRNSFGSSILYYESNRQIINIQPLQYTWELNNPDEEVVDWNLYLNPLSSGRFQDTLHSIFKKVQSQKTAIANKAIQLKESGYGEMKLSFSDPLEPFKAAFAQLLSPKILLGVNIQSNSLRIKDGEQEITEKALSSGEREVLNIAFDFILRNPSDCVVFFDEPELHLHPELANRLLNTLKTIGERNQFIFCTHSAELISGNLDNSIIFIQPQTENGQNQAVSISLEEQTYDALRAIGQSIGVVSLGKKVVLIEGQHSSLDKKTYLQILKGRYPELVLVPCESKYTIQSFSHIADSILEKTLWGVNFYMLSDRDAFPKEIENKVKERGLQDKVKSLRMYHLENYFLDENILAEIFSSMESEDSWLRKPDEIKRCLKEIAETRIGYATALTVSKLLRDTVGNIDVMIKSCEGKNNEALQNSFSGKAHEELHRVQSVLQDSVVRGKVDEYFSSYMNSLQSDNWKIDVPGKQIFKKFCSKARMDEDRVKTLYIEKAVQKKDGPFQEIFNIFDEFSG